MPERANYYDFGVQQKVSSTLTVGLDTYYKQSRDLIDEGQFGAPIILTPFNYAHGKQYGAEFTVQLHAGTFTAYLNLAAQSANGKDIDSAQFNFAPADLAYIANNYIHLDHEQQLTASGGCPTSGTTRASARTCCSAPACGRIWTCRPAPTAWRYRHPERRSTCPTTRRSISARAMCSTCNAGGR